MNDIKLYAHGDAEHVIAAMKRIREASTTPAMDAAAALQSTNQLAALRSRGGPMLFPRRPWYRKLWPFDVERVAVVVIAFFVAWIAIDHHRQVNARVEAAKACGDVQK